MSLGLDTIRAHCEKYAKAIGPGGEKAWLAGTLADAVPALLAKVEEQRVQLRDAHNDLLDVRGILAPADAARLVPMELVPRVAPAVRWLVDELAKAQDRLDDDAWTRKEAELAEARAEVQRLRDEFTGLGLREHWAALYVDGTWSSGEGDTRAEAEEIVAESRSGEPVRLAWRWISDWHLPEVVCPRCKGRDGTHTVRNCGEKRSLHIGRSWVGHEIEDGCPCPQAACGLVDTDTIDPGCKEHALLAAKSSRQGHWASECDGHAKAVVSGE